MLGHRSDFTKAIRKQQNLKMSLKFKLKRIPYTYVQKVT